MYCFCFLKKHPILQSLTTREIALSAQKKEGFDYDRDSDGHPSTRDPRTRVISQPERLVESASTRCSQNSDILFKMMKWKRNWSSKS